MAAPPSPGPPIKVDRPHTTPFLLRLFYRPLSFHPLAEFRPNSQPRDHIQIYTWRDCTLHELSLLLSDALPHICPPRSRCGFRLIYADTRYGSVRYTSKDLGVVTPAEPEEGSAKRTLGEVQFVVGDWIDVAVYPEGHGGVAQASRGGFAGRGRENGFGGRFGGRGGRGGGFGDLRSVPQGEWRRGENVDDVPPPPPGADAGMRGGRGGGFRRGGGRRYRD